GVTVSNDLVINGSLTLNSISNEFASLIVSGTVTGEITYSRYVNIEGSGEWDLIGPPVDGLDMTTFINDNSSLATNPTNADLYAIGSYDNSTDEWTNYTLATANGNNVELGVGYQMATDSGTTLDFTGDVAITDQTTSIINNDGNGSGRRWNLVANPYPSYLNINSAAHATDNFLTINLANGNVNIDAEFSAVYGWNADGTGYSSYDNNDTAKYMAPGQGFFVAASGSVDLDFTTAMRTVSGGDDFIVGDAVEFPEVYLNLYNGDMVMGQTHVRFRDNMTLGLNPSYDVGSYNQNAAITTRLVEEDQGTNFEHQNLPINAIQNVTIPLVINQAAGQEFKVNLHTSTIYDSNVYLEDTEEGTFTNLNEVDFSLTPTSDLSGAGRFFIHITADTMSNEDVSTSMLNAYKEANNNYITIEGLATQSNNINVSLYNILGRKVLDTSLSNNMNTQTISTLGMASGIYVIELESGNDRLTKKLIIQ
ncbi:MAG: T9SS type A sorting domain-containing protein, partial [Flavobacteriaceae bacterium]|nr:T9SS type A sorting domain-containing protein [Flavobacteriaceae bacterium]